MPIPTFLLGSLVLAFAGCFKLDPVSFDENGQREKVVDSNVGPITLLRVDPNELHTELVFKGNSESDQIEEFVLANKGAKLQIGIGKTGKSKIEFKNGDLPRDMTVFFEWANGSVYRGRIDNDETPGGEFNRPVKVELSYKWAHLSDVNQDDLALYHLNSKTSKWEVIKFEINQGARKVKAYIDRFGEYAIFQNIDGTLNDLYKRDPNTYYTEKSLKAKKGGKVELGVKEIGKSLLVFKKYDLPYDMTISFEWAASGWFEGFAQNLEFSPDGIEFNNPVKLELTYKNADLTGVDEDNLKLFFFNEDTEEWEIIGGTVDKKGKRIIAYIKHFSRYAISIGK